MKLKIQAARRRTLSGWLSSAVAVTVAAVMVAGSPTQAMAIATPVPLATAASFPFWQVRALPTPAPP
ncbi:hypothetical protein [Streptomyces manipurensis]|uniref:hypothetical protein n=1 Tax=Streptomyces manipurensis TaxID=1077945 RepID=UPI003C70421C